MEKSRDMEGEGKGDGHQVSPTRAKAQDIRASPNSLETRLVRK